MTKPSVKSVSCDGIEDDVVCLNSAPLMSIVDENGNELLCVSADGVLHIEMKKDLA